MHCGGQSKPKCSSEEEMRTYPCAHNIESYQNKSMNSFRGISSVLMKYFLRLKRSTLHNVRIRLLNLNMLEAAPSF